MKRTKWKVLVIDDSRADAALLRRSLERIPEYDAQVTVCHTAAEGEAEVSKAAYDCVLLDYRLGAASGLDVLHVIRGSGNDVPVVFLTGFGNESIAVEAMKSGAQDYLAKDSVAPHVLRRSLSNSMHQVTLERRVREKQRELEHFVSVVAHDLQQPLCVVLGDMELIRDYYAEKLDDTAMGFVTAAIGMAGRMSAMIESLLAYSRVGRTAKALRAVDLNSCLEVVTASLAHVIEKSRGQVVYRGLPCVEGDEQALAQLFQNLVANGLKFRGEADPIVSISATADGGNWHIAVRDNGIGIHREHHDEIFQPFKRLHSRSEYDGSGVGLATCKRIIDQHHGQIWLESEPGKGSAFHLTLRAPKQADLNVEAASVLVVAQDGGIVAALTEELLLKGYGAIVARDVEEALDLLGRHPVDIVAVDLSTRRRAGADGINQIRERYPSIRLLSISGAEGKSVDPSTDKGDGHSINVDSKLAEIEQVIHTLSQGAAPQFGPPERVSSAHSQ